MPNNGEIISDLSKTLAQREMLELARECKDLDEFMQKLQAILNDKRN